MGDVSVLRSCIKDGLFVNNLKKLVKLCSDLAQREEHPAPFYILRCIFMEFALKWEGEAVGASEIKAAEDKLVPRIEAILAQCQGKGGRGVDYSDLNLLVKDSIGLLG